MKRINIGEFEELILLVVAVLYDNAYGVAIMHRIKDQTGRSVNISAIHEALRRLEAKGYARSRLGEATKKRGGRRKRIFSITRAGMHAIDQVRLTRNELWNQIPNISFS